MVSDHLPPRATLLVLGRLVAGGGGRATSSQSPESGGGKPTPGTFGGGRSLRGDTGVGSTLSSSVSSSGLLNDTEAIERVISLERSQFSAVREGAVSMTTYSNSDER
jgi:hypothetical protein